MQQVLKFKQLFNTRKRSRSLIKIFRVIVLIIKSDKRFRDSSAHYGELRVDLKPVMGKTVQELSY